MSVKVGLTLADENDFQKHGKWFFWSDNSSWKTSSKISMDMNDSLADISELNGERESETNSGATVHGTTTAMLAINSRMTITPRRPRHLWLTEKKKEILRKQK